MRWKKTLEGYSLARGTHGREWVVVAQKIRQRGRASLFVRDAGKAVDTRVAECASFAEAQVIVAGLERAASFRREVLEVLQRSHFVEMSDVPAEAVMGIERQLALSGGKAALGGGHRWFASTYCWTHIKKPMKFVAIGEDGALPVAVFSTLENGEIVLDSALCVPVLRQGVGRVDAVRAFLTAYTEINRFRVMYGSKPNLVAGQQHEIVESIEKGKLDTFDVSKWEFNPYEIDPFGPLS